MFSPRATRIDVSTERWVNISRIVKADRSVCNVEKYTVGDELASLAQSAARLELVRSDGPTARFVAVINILLTKYYFRTLQNTLGSPKEVT